MALFERGLTVRDMVRSYTSNSIQRLLKLVNEPVHRRPDESDAAYEARRVGGYNFHTRWMDRDEEDETPDQYRPIMEIFPTIYRQYHYPASTRPQTGKQSHVFRTAFFVEHFMAQEEAVDEFRNVVLQDDKESSYDGGEEELHAADIGKLVIAMAKSEETLVRLCDEKCPIPPTNWAIDLRDKINALRVRSFHTHIFRHFQSMSLEEAIEHILGFARCDHQATTKTTIDDGCTDSLRTINILAPCYQRLRTIQRYIRDLRQCSKYLRAWDEILEQRDSVELRALLEKPAVPAPLRKTLSVSLAVAGQEEQHTEQAIRAQFGNWIDRVVQQFNANEDQACFICQMLHTKDKVRGFLCTWHTFHEKFR